MADQQAPSGQITPEMIAAAVAGGAAQLPDLNAADAAASLAATTVVIGGITVSLATARAYQLAIEGILRNFDEMVRRRMERVQLSLSSELNEEFPGLPENVLMDFVSEEMERERLFISKSRDRVARDLPNALMGPDPQEAIASILDRERRPAWAGSPTRTTASLRWIRCRSA